MKNVTNKNDSRLTSQAGLTLLELVIAMGIASFLLLVNMSLHVQTLQAFQASERYSSLNSDSYLLNDYFRIETMKAGGGYLRGWMGLHVENNCNARGPFAACNGSDRLHTVSIALPEQECAITAHAVPNRITASFRAPGDCCLQPNVAQTGARSFADNQVVISLNGAFINRYVSQIDPLTCTAILVPGQASFADMPQAMTDFTGGVISLVQVRTHYWDSNNRTLNLFQDVNGDGIAQSTETQIISEQIYDFQVSLGYDFEPVDGLIDETADGANDEWLYNSLQVTERPDFGDFSAPWRRDQLLLVRVGVLTGTSQPGYNAGNLPNMFDGPVRNFPDVFTRPVITRTAPRNTLMFQ